MAWFEVYHLQWRTNPDSSTVSSPLLSLVRQARCTQLQRDVHTPKTHPTHPIPQSHKDPCWPKASPLIAHFKWARAVQIVLLLLSELNTSNPSSPTGLLLWEISLGHFWKRRNKSHHHETPNTKARLSPKPLSSYHHKSCRYCDRSDPKSGGKKINQRMKKSAQN